MGLNEIASYFPLTTYELGRGNLLQLQYGKKKHGVLITLYMVLMRNFSNSMIVTKE